MFLQQTRFQPFQIRISSGNAFRVDHPENATIVKHSVLVERLERLSCDVLPAELLPLRESATLQSIDGDAYPGEAHTGARPAAEFWQAYEAWKARQTK